MEFTDVFVAIARAAGIPARQAIGYAYTTNTKLRPLSLVTDVLHAWPEYYDSTLGIWVPIDPTWESTTGGVDYFNKLDFNHIVFAINGIRDDYPYPAGSYRPTGKGGKILDIQFADSQNAKHLPGRLAADIIFPDMIASGLVSHGILKVRNPSGVAFDDLDVFISSEPHDTSVTRSIAHLPPYGTEDIPFQFSTGTFLFTGKGAISAKINGELHQKHFDIRPVHVIIGGAAVVAVGILALIWLILERHQKIHGLRRR
jgi:hypothetical protein